MGMTFSSDGRFFACGTVGLEINLWKESSTGYALHRRLVSGIDKPLATYAIEKKGTKPLLSPNGESIVTSKYSETQLWRTTDPTTSLSSAPTRPTERPSLLLEFSPDRSVTAAARLGDNMVTVLDLNSGNPRLIIDTGTKICGLKVTGDVIIVVGEGRIITWNLPTRDHVLDTRVDINDSVRTVMFNHQASPPERPHSAGIFPDLKYIVITGVHGKHRGVDIYNMSTGKWVAGVNAGGAHLPFAPDGHEVWAASYTQGGKSSRMKNRMSSRWNISRQAQVH